MTNTTGDNLTATENPIVELIESGAPLSRLRRDFPDAESAYLTYARYQAAKFGTPAPLTCVVCHQPAKVTVRYSWWASFSPKAKPGIATILLLSLGHLHVKIESKVIKFPTYHSFCQSCWNKQVLKIVLAAFVNFVALLVGIGALFTFGASTGLFIYMRNDPTEKHHLLGFALTALAALATLVLCAFGLKSLIHLRVPKALKSIPRRPFVYVGAQKTKPGEGPPAAIETTLA